MKVQKPSNVLFNQAYHTIGGQAYLFLTVSYICDKDNQLLDEQIAWPWLKDAQQFEEPLDYGLKKTHGVFGVIGNAYAPDGQPTQSMIISASLGNIKKQLAVYGDRFWQTGFGLKSSKAVPFVSMPVNLSHAFGGPESPDNIYGKGYLAKDSKPDGQPLPNIEYIESPILNPNDKPLPATFGVLPAAGQTRAGFLGGFDQTWLQETAPWIPLNTDESWFDLVPQDQVQKHYWQGDEAWSVTGMHPTQHKVEGWLPGLRPRMLIRQSLADKPDQHQQYEPELQLDTVWLYPEQQYLMLSYRAAIPVCREDGADVLALAIYTEHLNQQPASFDELLAQWQTDQASETDIDTLAMPGAVAGAGASAGALADMATASDDLIPELSDLPDSETMSADLAADLHDEFAQMQTEQDKAIAGFEQQGLLDKSDLPAAQTPDFADLIKQSLADDNDAAAFDLTEEDISSEVQNEIDEVNAEVEDHLKKLADEQGLDADELIGALHSGKASSASMDYESLTEHIKKLDIPADLKADMLGNAKAFDGEMQSVDTDIAGVTQNLNKLLASIPGVYMGLDNALGTGDRLSAKNILDHIQEQPDLSGLRLENLDFSGHDMASVVFDDAQIINCKFIGCNLHKATFKQAFIDNCDFHQADLNHGSWQGADIKDSNFVEVLANGSKFDQVTAFNCKFDKSQLIESDWSSANLTECSLVSINLSNSTLVGTSFFQVSAEQADLTNCHASDLRIYANSDFNCSVFEGANLENSSIQSSSFKNANFNQLKLNSAFFDNCDLTGSHAWQMEAKNTVFKDCTVSRANWSAANLMQADFSMSVVQESNFCGCNLYAIETRTAVFKDVLLQDALLSRTRLDPAFKEATL